MRFSVVSVTLAWLLAAGGAEAQGAGDAANGKAVFARCAICHNVDSGGHNGLGPNIVGVAGRKAASLPDFSYSDALKSSGITWTDDKLSEWVSGPAKMVPGTKMAFPGITSKADIRNVVAYLDTLK